MGGRVCLKEAFTRTVRCVGKSSSHGPTGALEGGCDRVLATDRCEEGHDIRLGGLGYWQLFETTAEVVCTLVGSGVFLILCFPEGWSR